LFFTLGIKAWRVPNAGVLSISLQVIYSGDLASRGDEKTLAMSVDVGTVASAFVSSDTS
jgi:hypothetical protein